MLMTIKSYAKINLSLEIIKKREDSYHEIKSIMQKIDLHDSIEIETLNNTSNIILTCNNPLIPTDDKNLAIKAAKAFFANSGIKSGLKIHLEKNIPTGGGLGGGSSNAAIILKALNEINNKVFDNKALNILASQIGADVAFFLEEHPTKLASGIGEKLETIKSPDSLPILLILPNIESNTNKAYQSLRLEELKSTGEKTTLLKQSLEMGFFKEGLRYMHNDFEKFVFEYIPILKEIKNILINSNSLNTLMSGSGSSIFSIFENDDILEKELTEIKKQIALINSNTKIIKTNFYKI